MLKKGWSRRGQLTIFIIIAIVIVAGVAAYLILRNQPSSKTIPERFKQVEEYFLQCIEENAKMAIGAMGEQAGYIYLPEFSPGSDYMPTSNMLNFLGTPVPYWYYISGNNLVKEQVPSKQEMEEQLSRYLGENLYCDFSYYSKSGYDVSLGEKKVDVVISDKNVKINLDADLNLGYEDSSYIINRHEVIVSSNFGKNYNLARDILAKEKSENFLENYALDTLHLNAPVDNVELSCSPKVWAMPKVRDDLKKALEANTIMLNTDAKYFNLELGENVRFLYSKDWPAKIETGEEVLVAEPVGNQPGLGILGFCYVPYHFVYDIVYPTLVQIYDGRELFQFPVAVIIRGNQPRAADGSLYREESEICSVKNSEIEVTTYNTNLELIDADISFKCFNEKCDIGKTTQGKIIANFPKCINGFILAKGEGYELKKLQASTNNPSSYNIILDRLYNLSVDLRANGKQVSDLAIVNFLSEDTTKTIAWPEMAQIELTEGLYNISVYIYKNSSISIPGTTEEKCVQSAKPGLLGLFGATEEKCFTLEIPNQIVSNIISGGGSSQQYVSETELQRGHMEIQAELIETPTSLEQLQNNFNLIEDKNVYLEFK